MIFRKEKVKDLPPMIFLLIFDFWAGTVWAIIDITDALLPTIAQHFNLFQSFKAEANDGG